MRIYDRYSDDKLEELGLSGKLPKHVGIIMDGNGRWAKSRLMPRPVGHRAGMEALHEIVREAHCLGLEALTVYAFSTENWQRRPYQYPLGQKRCRLEKMQEKGYPSHRPWPFNLRGFQKIL